MSSFQLFQFHLLPLVFIYFVINDTTSAVESGDSCGTVMTSGGDVITLRENEILPKEDFDKIHIQKLQNAIFSPVQERKCLIKVCGFTSFPKPRNQPDGCIGSASDLMDCQIITTQANADDRYNEHFNASSISCGCYKQRNQGALPCESKCPAKKQSLDSGAIPWKDNECAILYREFDCKDCYYDAIKLETGKETITNNAHHFNSIIVRDKCTVSHNVSALRRICRFENLSGIFTHTNVQVESTDFTPRSAYQVDPEVFTCTCSESVMLPTNITASNTAQSTTPPVSIMSNPTKSPVSSLSLPTSSNHDTGEKVYFQIALGVITIGLIITSSTSICLLVSRRKQLQGNMMDPEKIKRSAVESRETEFTECSESLEFNHILNLPMSSEFETFREDFELGNWLGGGHFGDVYLGKMKVAIKCVKKDTNAEDKELSRRSLQHEIKILSTLGSHENVIRLMGACYRNYENGEIYLLTEYCENGSLKDYLKKTIRPHIMNKIRHRILNNLSVSDDGYHETTVNTAEIDISEKTAHDLQELDPIMLKQFLQWSEEIANGMQYITLKKVVHVDLAARNVLLTHNLTAKIGDFGLSKKIYVKEYVTSKKDSFPILWVAPESLTQNKYSSKSDVWAYGVTLWEIFTIGKDPYDELDSMKEIISAIIQGEGLIRAEFATDDVHSKLIECWKEKPEERPSFQDLKDYFFALKNSLQQQTLDSTQILGSELSV